MVMKFPENRKLGDIINTEEDRNIMWDNLDDLMVSEIQIEWHLILNTAKSWVQRQKGEFLLSASESPQKEI